MLARSTIRTSRAISARSFSAAAVRMAETGQDAVRATYGQGDKLSDKAHANEDAYIHKQQAEKLANLRKQLQQQQKATQDLLDHLDKEEQSSKAKK